MYAGNAVVINFLMRWPALAPAAVAAGIVTIVAPVEAEAPPAPPGIEVPPPPAPPPAPPAAAPAPGPAPLPENPRILPPKKKNG